MNAVSSQERTQRSTRRGVKNDSSQVGGTSLGRSGAQGLTVQGRWQPFPRPGPCWERTTRSRPSPVGIRPQPHSVFGEAPRTLPAPARVSAGESAVLSSVLRRARSRDRNRRGCPKSERTECSEERFDYGASHNAPMAVPPYMPCLWVPRPIATLSWKHRVEALRWMRACRKRVCQRDS